MKEEISEEDVAGETFEEVGEEEVIDGTNGIELIRHRKNK